MIGNYYLEIGGEKEGPYTFDELTAMELEVDTMVLTPSADTWQMAGDVPELYPYFEAQGIYLPTGDNFAGFLWRLSAYVIDCIILTIGFVIAILVAKNYGKGFDLTMENVQSAAFNFGAFGLIIIYHSIFEATTMRGSPGKLICKLVVVDANGMRLSYSKALLRNACKLLSSIPFDLGYFNVLWNAHSQAWHDMIAKTYVIKRG